MIGVARYYPKSWQDKRPLLQDLTHVVKKAPLFDRVAQFFVDKECGDGQDWSGYMIVNLPRIEPFRISPELLDPEEFE